MGLELHPKTRIIRDDNREMCGIAGPEKKHILISKLNFDTFFEFNILMFVYKNSTKFLLFFFIVR